MIRRRVLGFGAFAACIVAATAARADLVYELSPTAGAGAADNVYGGQHYSDAFTTVGGFMRLRYDGARATHALGYSIGYSKYFEQGYPDTLSNSLNWLSTINPSPMWSLHLGASGTVTRSSGLDVANPMAVVPEAAIAGAALYVTTAATQGIEVQPSPRWNLGETVMVGYVRYLDQMFAGMPGLLPRTIYTTLTLRGERLVGKEAFGALADVSDSWTTYAASAATPPPQGQWIFARALATWRHELSPMWSTMLQAGPSVIYLVDGPGVAAPVIVAALNYSRLPWFATLTAQQTPMPNPYLGAAVLADQIVGRVAVPLTRSERVVVGGFGGYSYARIADANGEFERAYDQFLGGLTLMFRFPKMPLSLLGSYTVMSQRGGSVPGYEVEDRASQYVFFTLRGDIAFGRGTPPIFGGD
jgi:hypothetical protein